MANSLAYLTSGKQKKKDNKINDLFLPPPPLTLKILVKKNNRPLTSPYVWHKIVHIYLPYLTKPYKTNNS
jgi:hypothetical protein